MAVSYDFGTGGFEILFTFSASSPGSVSIKCDSAFVERDKSLENPYGTIEFVAGDEGFDINLYRTDLVLIESMSTDLMVGGSRCLIRVTVHNEFISIYSNGRWVNTFWLKGVKHKEEPTIWVSGTPGNSIVDVLFPELNDWRDAIFIDLEQTGMNAISSVVLSKPIEIWNKATGEICFAMNFVRDQIQVHKGHLRRISEEHSRNNQACSDGIVYFTDVAVVIDEEYLQEYGFSTRLIKVPDLDQGIRAGTRMQDRARKSQNNREISMRYDPRIEYRDVVRAIVESKTAQGTLDANCLVENMRVTLKENSNELVVSGRKEL
jgi:hypothetical protein